LVIQLWMCVGLGGFFAVAALFMAIASFGSPAPGAPFASLFGIAAVVLLAVGSAIGSISAILQAQSARIEALERRLPPPEPVRDGGAPPHNP